MLYVAHNGRVLESASDDDGGCKNDIWTQIRSPHNPPHTISPHLVLACWQFKLTPIALSCFNAEVQQKIVANALS